MLPEIMVPSSWGNTPQYTGLLEVLIRALAQYNLYPSIKVPTKTWELFTVYVIPPSENKQNAPYLMDFVWDYFPSNISTWKTPELVISIAPLLEVLYVNIRQEDAIPSLNCLAEAVSKHTKHLQNLSKSQKGILSCEIGRPCCSVAKCFEAAQISLQNYKVVTDSLQSQKCIENLMLCSPFSSPTLCLIYLLFPTVPSL